MRRIPFILFMVLVGSVVVFGQQHSGVIGTVIDPSGAKVPGAKITVTNIETGLTRTTVTNGTGDYSIPELPVGVYRVNVRKSGFRPAVVQSIKLDVQRTARVDFTLEVGPVTEEVTVKNQIPLLQTTQSHLGTLIDNEEIVDLPLNGRNYLQLNLLIPGTTTGNSNADYIFNTHGGSGVAVSVNGQRSLYNSYLIDGAPTEEVEDGAPAFEPSIDAIQEFRIATSNYSAQFGGMAGGQINLVTKSGANQFHGSAYDFLRNNALDARSFFSPSSAPLIRNQFGGTVGGPIRRNHTFFFGGYEGLRVVNGGTERGIIPTAAQRKGDFSSLLAQGIQLKNPVTGQPFVNNQVPVNPIIGQFLQNYVPLPNNPSGPIFNWILTDASGINHNDIIGRIDHNFSSNDSVFGRYIFENVNNTSAKFFPTDSYQITARGMNMDLGYTHIAGANKVNDLRLAYNRFAQNENNGHAGKVDVLNQLGIHGFCENSGCWGEPDFDVLGFSGFGEHGSGQTVSGPRRWVDEIFNASDTFTYTKGAHLLKAGIMLNKYHDSFQEAIFPRGIYSFDGRFANPGGAPSAQTSFPDFLLGYPRSILASIDVFVPYWSYTGVFPWIEDDWRVTPNLTLNLGLRYERISRPGSRYNDYTTIDLAQSPAQLVTPATASQFGFPHNLVYNDNDDLAPRLGFAWVPSHFKRIVIRGAYGVFYQRELINTWTDLAINLPFIQQTNFILEPASVSSFSLSDPLASALRNPLLVFAIDKNWQDGLVQQWNLSWQTEVSPRTQATISYVGNTGEHLSRTWDPNQATPGPGTVASRRPFQGFGVIYYLDSGARTNYNSLQAEIQRRFAGGLTFLASYTYSKCMSSSPGTFSGEAGSRYINARDMNLMYALCSQDMRNRFVGSYIYALPFGRGKRFGSSLSNALAVRLISGWNVSGITTVSDGFPFSVAMPGDWANVGDGTITPILNANPNLPGSQRTLGRFFNTSAFLAPPPGQFGNAGPNIVIGPGLVDFDFAVLRNFKIHESEQLQFRAEAFNVFNRPNFGDPGATFGTPTFGVISSAGAGREIQFALKFLF